MISFIANMGDKYVILFTMVILIFFAYKLIKYTLMGETLFSYYRGDSYIECIQKYFILKVFFI